MEKLLTTPSIMTNEEILKKAIVKAVWNGWETELIWCDVCNAIQRDMKINGVCVKEHPLVVLFDPEWAKFFFGKNWKNDQINMLRTIQKGSNPIKYLEQYL